VFGALHVYAQKARKPMSGTGMAGRIKRAVAALLRGRAIASNQLGSSFASFCEERSPVCISAVF